MKLTIELPDDLADQIAAKVAELLVDQLGAPVDPDRLMTVPEAAEYLRAKPQRVYDLVGQGRIEAERDGTRVLIRKAALDRHLAGGSR
jgi:excisionase family DNA binding protein